MLQEHPCPRETIRVRVVESCGMAIALPAEDVVDVQPLMATPELLERTGDLRVMRLGGLSRPVVSLQQALCLELPADRVPREDQVVVLRVGTQLFGLLAERAHPPEPVEVLPTRQPAPRLAVFSMLVQRGDEITFVLNPIRLALSTGGTPMPGLSAAA